MPSTRSKESNTIDKNESIKTITRSTTCKDLFSHNDLEFVCKNCYNSVDILSISRSKKRNNVKHRTKKCDQAWNESYATTSTKASFHVKICKRLNIKTNVGIEDEFKYKATQSHSSEPTEITSKCNTSVASSYVCTKKISSYESNESIPSSKKLKVNDEKDATLHYPKQQMFATMMDPLMLSSLNYLSTLTPTELHNCVTLHKQSVALASSRNNVENIHINKKTKLCNLNETTINPYKQCQSLSSLSSLSESSEEKSQSSDKTSDSLNNISNISQSVPPPLIIDQQPPSNPIPLQLPPLILNHPVPPNTSNSVVN